LAAAVAEVEEGIVVVSSSATLGSPASAGSRLPCGLAHTPASPAANASLASSLGKGPKRATCDFVRRAQTEAPSPTPGHSAGSSSCVVSSVFAAVFFPSPFVPPLRWREHSATLPSGPTTRAPPGAATYWSR